MEDYVNQSAVARQLQLNLMCKPFTLILGNSRIDMTVLPKALAEKMGATKENGRYLQLQVRPDWMDSSDLIGWLNLEGKFIPGALVDFFKAACDDPEHAYFLCLDRIILSRAEYYLRDFITAVDMRGEPDCKPYVPKIYFGRDEDAIRKYGEIPPLKNLFVVGTVNLDETSLPLPQKFLDRVHTMSLAGEMGEIDFADVDLSTRYYRLDQWEEASVIDSYIQEFEKINKILMQATSYLGFKIRNEGILYLLHNRTTGLLPEKTAMDHVLTQKVLPRIQGGAKLIQPMLESFLTYCRENDYPDTTRKAAQMLVQCAQNGYCSCWETE